MKIDSTLLANELVPENMCYKVDSSSRVVIPRHIRAKFNVEAGDLMEYYTTEVDGRYFLVITKKHDDAE